MDAVKHLLQQRLTRVKQELLASESEQRRWEEAVEGCKETILRLQVEQVQIERHLESFKEVA